MTHARPALRPSRPNFSSGPCAKRPGWSFAALENALLGRNHRYPAPKARINEVITRSRAVLEMPPDWRLGIIAGSDTGAVEAAMWSLLGPRPVDILAWEHFSEQWAIDAVAQLRLPNARVMATAYGVLPDLSAVDMAHDIVFPWNGTAAGVRVPNGDWISGDRAGLTICDATSAAFAMDLPWQKLDVVTWSWQKVLGGEAGHGMIALSPRAAERLQTHTPAWPVPKIFRLAENNQILEGIFTGETINTPSMLCVEDAIDALRWAESIGGLRAMIARSERSLATLAAWVGRTNWVSFLAQDPAARSSTSICLTTAEPTAAPNMARRLENEGVAFDIANYRDAPAGLRVWGGATVEPEDIALLIPWLDWAWQMRAEPL